jgi:hypothetical protein
MDNINYIEMEKFLGFPKVLSKNLITRKKLFNQMKVQDHFLVDHKTLHTSFFNQTWFGFPKCAKSSKGFKAQEMTLFWNKWHLFL